MFGPLEMPDAQLIEILIAAMVAGVILFRLYTMLGRRTGHEPQPQDRAPGHSACGQFARPAGGPARRTPGAQPVRHPAWPIPVSRPVISSSGARSAYEIILKAFAGGDRASLKPLLSDEVYKAFDADIAEPGTAPPAETLAGITDARIVQATLEGKTAEITVSFRAQFAHGAPASGDYVQRDVTDVWTFARQIGASSPTWTLVATSGALALSAQTLVALVVVALLLAALGCLVVQPGPSRALAARVFLRSSRLAKRGSETGAGRLPPQLRRDRRKAAAEADRRLCRHARRLAESLRAGWAATRAAFSKRISRPIAWAAKASSPAITSREIHGSRLRAWRLPDAGLWPAARSDPGRSRPILPAIQRRTYFRPPGRASSWCLTPTGPRSTPMASPTRRSCSGATIRWRCSSCRSRARAGCGSTMATWRASIMPGENGRPYTAIGRVLVASGRLARRRSFAGRPFAAG